MSVIQSDLSGHVALITGASRGIGRAISRRLAAHGAAVVVSASARSCAGLDETRELICQGGGQAASVEADLANAVTRERLVARAAEYFGPIDILVNNAAAISAYAPPSTIDLPARQAMFEVNLQAPIDLIQQALPAMRSRGWGRILNISSETAQPPPILLAGPARLVHALVLYGASKAALDRYTLGLAAELHGTGITVNSLAPYRIAASESAAQVAALVAKTKPEWVEPLEMMAEGA